MRRPLLLSCVLSVATLLAQVAVAAPACEGGHDITIEGTVRDLKVSRSTPQAEPKLTFTLVKPSCGDSDIAVGGLARFNCTEGDHAVVRGQYYPPNEYKKTPSVAITLLTCTAPTSN